MMTTCHQMYRFKKDHNFMASGHAQDLPHKIEMQYVHIRLYANYYLFPWKIPEEISRQSMLFNNCGSIYHTKQTYVDTTFYNGK